MQTKEPCDVISSGMLIKNAWDIFNLCRSSLLRMRTANLFYGSIKCVSLVSILHISWKLTDTLQWSSASNSSSKIPQQDKKKRFSKRVFEEKLLVCESRKYLYNVTSPRHSGKHSLQTSWEETGQGIKCELDGGEGNVEILRDLRMTWWRPLVVVSFDLHTSVSEQLQ